MTLNKITRPAIAFCLALFFTGLLLGGAFRLENQRRESRRHQAFNRQASALKALLDERSIALSRLAERTGLYEDGRAAAADIAAYKRDFKDLQSLAVYRKERSRWNREAGMGTEAPPSVVSGLQAESFRAPAQLTRVGASWFFVNSFGQASDQTILVIGELDAASLMEQVQRLTEEPLSLALAPPSAPGVGSILGIDGSWGRINLIPLIPRADFGHAGDLDVQHLAWILSGIFLAGVCGISAWVFDRAKKLNAETARVRQERSALLELAPVGILFFDEAGNWTHVNRYWANMAGLETDEIPWERWLLLVHPEDRANVEADWPRGRQVVPARSMDFRLMRSDGQVIWVQGSLTAIQKNGQGEAIRMATFFDISKIRATKAALREKEKFLSAVIDNLPVALFCKDVKNGFSYTLWNSRAEEMWGWSRSEVLNKNDFDFNPPDLAKSYREKDLEIIQSGQSERHIEDFVIRSDGKEVWAKSTKVALTDEDGSPHFLVGMSEDITAAKALQGELDRQRAQSAQVEKLVAIGELAAGIAHEINNPLAIISANSSLLKRRIHKLPGDHSEIVQHADIIGKNVERAAKIIKGMQTLSRSGDEDPVEACSLSEVVAEALGFCQSRFSQKEISVVVEALDTMPTVQFRHVQLVQVLLNLLNNAFFAALQSPHPRVSIFCESSGTTFSIWIKNSGIPPSAEDERRLASPFFTTKAQGAGTGLGLFISKALAEKNGARLGYQKKEGQAAFGLLFDRVGAKGFTV